MPGDAGDLFKTAEEFLAACAKALEDAPAGTILNQAIWQGPPAFDCAPALYVHAGGPSIADTYPLQPPLQPAQRIAETGIVNMVAFTATVLRCIPVLEGDGQTILLPARSEITASSADIYGDLWAIWNFLVYQHRNGNLWQTQSRRRELILDPAIPLRNSGGVGGWQLQIRVQIGGYPNGPAAGEWSPDA